MLTPTAHLLPGKTNRDRRLHLNHGPIDLIIGVDADEKRQNAAFRLANSRFETILQELVDELAFLRSPANPDMRTPKGSTAKRMVAAVRSLSTVRFITPMAAVAGAVADEILESIQKGFAAQDLPDRIYVNNGGDIAIHLSASSTYTATISAEDRTCLGTFQIHATSPSRGIATSGRGGRSLSMGIAESVTVISRNAAEADAIATLIANAVDLPGHPLISRAKASDLVDNSDLGDRLVVKDCGPLSGSDIQAALNRGVLESRHLANILPFEKTAMFLQGRSQLFVADQPEFHYRFSQPSPELAHHA